MRRLAVVADSHYDEHSRFEECIRLHKAIHKDAAERGVDATIHTGDLYERKSTPLERQAAAEWVQLMAMLGQFLLVRGNHDAIDDLPLLERLLTRHVVRVVQGAELVPLGPDVTVAAVAWPRKAALLAATGAESHEAGERSAADALRSVFRGLGAQMAGRSGVRLLAMHAMLSGSLTSTGQPLVGCDLEVGLADLALLDAHAYLLGHIHKGQRFQIGSAPVVYPGSPRRTAFGESEAKGYTVVGIEGGQVVECEFVELPATPMVHISALWDGERLVTDDAPFLPGAEVRLRYTTPSDQREAAAAGAFALRDNLLAAGAVLVKVEPIVIAEQRARAPELAQALTLEDKVQALWRAQNWDPGDRRSALLAKLRDLQEAS